MPRCEPIAERYYGAFLWSLLAYDDQDSSGETPPIGYVRFDYQILEELKFEEGNLFQLWYNLLGPKERFFWHTFMKKAQQKIEYRWDDFMADTKDGKIQEDEAYEPVGKFDPRFYYYDKPQQVFGIGSFAAKVLNPKKRKPESETTGEGLPQNPTAKRKPDGASETSRGSPSGSPSASQDQTTMELETPSGSLGRSIPVTLTAGVPQARPTHTPVSAGEFTDTELNQERSGDTTAERHPDVEPTQEEEVVEENHQYVAPPERDALLEDQISGDPVLDLETLIYQEIPELVTAKDLIHPVIMEFVDTMESVESPETEAEEI